MAATKTNGITNISTVEIPELTAKYHKQEMKKETPKENGEKVQAPEMKWLDWVRIGVAEFIGTAYLVFIGCMGCMASVSGHAIPLEQIAWTFGLIVMMMIQTFAHISGAHLNPALSLLAVTLGHLSYKLLPLYCFSQIFGGIVGFSLLKAVTPGKYFDAREVVNQFNETVKEVGVCSTVPNPEIHVVQALIVEIVITAALCAVCCAIWDWRNANKHDSVTIRLGLTIAGLAMAGAPYSGGSMNPARSFGPSLINNDWSGHWIYWFGPILAAVVVGLGYRFLYAVPKPEPGNAHEEIPLNSNP